MTERNKSNKKISVSIVKCHIDLLMSLKPMGVNDINSLWRKMAFKVPIILLVFYTIS